MILFQSFSSPLAVSREFLRNAGGENACGGCADVVARRAPAIPYLSKSLHLTAFFIAMILHYTPNTKR